MIDERDGYWGLGETERIQFYMDFLGCEVQDDQPIRIVSVLHTNVGEKT